MIHRDLKPANLMIGAGDGDIGVRIRILDFGIAIIDEFDHAGRLIAQGAVPLGTLLYMAPEQLRGETLTPACDLYAVGLMTWEMFMGGSPFEGMTRSQMMFEKVTRSEGFALEASAALPAALQMFVEACTLPEPRSRPSARKGLAMLTNSLFIRGQVRE